MLGVLNSPMMFDRLFDDVLDGTLGAGFGANATMRGFSPDVDVRATDDAIVFACDVPGVKRDDIDVTLENGTLTIKGQRRYESGDQEKVWLGRGYGKFTKSYTLPDVVDGDHVSADLSDGVLTIRIPKKAQAKPRRIPIGVWTEAKQLEEKKD